MGTRGLATAVGASLLLHLLAAPAAAQPAPDQAQAAYEAGRRHYDLREWDRSIARFKEAYRLRAEPRSLFNIAQAYRLKGDCVEAVNFYKAFLRNYPEERGSDNATAFIDKLEGCRAKQAAASPPRPPPPDEPITPPGPEPQEGGSTEDTGAATGTAAGSASGDALPPVAGEPARSGSGLRIAGLVTGGLGLVAIGTGIYFGTQASARESELEDATVWDQGLFDRGRRADRNAKLLLAVGGAATIGGAALYFLGMRAGKEPRVAVIPADGGGGVVWSCAF